MWYYDGHKADEQTEILLEEDISDTGEHAHLIVYNDDYNSFDWVIQSFVEVLRHSSEQAEQLAILIHFKGKATVKTAPKSVLMPLKEGLIDRGLSAVIEGGSD